MHPAGRPPNQREQVYVLFGASVREFGEAIGSVHSFYGLHCTAMEAEVLNFHPGAKQFLRVKEAVR